MRGFDIEHRVEGFIGEGQVFGVAVNEIKARELVSFLAEGDAVSVEVQPRVWQRDVMFASGMRLRRHAHN